MAAQSKKKSSKTKFSITCCFTRKNFFILLTVFTTYMFLLPANVQQTTFSEFFSIKKLQLSQKSTIQSTLVRKFKSSTFYSVKIKKNANEVYEKNPATILDESNDNFPTTILSHEDINITTNAEELENLTLASIENLSDLTNKNTVKNIIRILHWQEHFELVDKTEQDFINLKCKYTNCIITSQQNFSHNNYDYTIFDAIIFATPYVFNWHLYEFPKVRLPHQKYIFASLESSAYYPVCSNRFDGFFNWTWTFRFDSDLHWKYIVIRNARGKMIGPKPKMRWMKKSDMDPVPQKLRDKLKGKTKLAMWMASNCYSRNKREEFVKRLNEELAKSGLEVDMYGECGNKLCSCQPGVCDEIVEKDFYFYLAFENSFNKDYVTEKILRPLQHDTVPVVYGEGNYTRFMPDGIYLNARELGVKKLAAKMIDLVNHLDEYVDYFKWKNHYFYEGPDTRKPDGNNFCALCALLNDKTRMQETTVVKKFREWWDIPDWC